MQNIMQKIKHVTTLWAFHVHKNGPQHTSGSLSHQESNRKFIGTPMYNLIRRIISLCKPTIHNLQTIPSNSKMFQNKNLRVFLHLIWKNLALAGLSYHRYWREVWLRKLRRWWYWNINNLLGNLKTELFYALACKTILLNRLKSFWIYLVHY